MADEPMIPATSEHPAIYRDGHRLTANKPAPPRSARDGETLSDDEIRKMLDDWRDSMIEVVRLRQELAALRAECARLTADRETLNQAVEDALFAMREPMTLGEARKGRAILTSYSVRQAIAAARAAAPKPGETTNG